MPIRDNAEARALLKNIDEKVLRTEIGQWLSKYLDGRDQKTLSNKEMEKVFLAASPSVQSKYGVDIWDAMMLLNVAQQENALGQESQSDDFDDWRSIYEALSDISERLGISPHLQEDYSGGHEFHVWCSSENFLVFASAIKDAKLITKSNFKVIVIEVSGDAPTGRQQSIATN